MTRGAWSAAARNNLSGWTSRRLFGRARSSSLGAIASFPVPFAQWRCVGACGAFTPNAAALRALRPHAGLQSGEKSRWGERQADRDVQPLDVFARHAVLQRDAAAQGVHDLLADREAQAGAAQLAARERLEQARLHLHGQARSR